MTEVSRWTVQGAEGRVMATQVGSRVVVVAASREGREDRGPLWQITAEFRKALLGAGVGFQDGGWREREQAGGYAVAWEGVLSDPDGDEAIVRRVSEVMVGAG